MSMPVAHLHFFSSIKIRIVKQLQTVLHLSYTNLSKVESGNIEILKQHLREAQQKSHMCRGRLDTRIQTKDIKFLGKCCYPFKSFKISIKDKQGGLTAETNKYEVKESKFPVPKLRTKYCRQSRPHFAHFCLEGLKCWVLRGKTKAPTLEFPVQLSVESSETLLLLRNLIHYYISQAARAGQCRDSFKHSNR